MSILANTTRRSVLAALARAALAPFPGKAAKKATAFALIGDRYHNSDYIRIGVTRTIAKELDVTIDFTDETSLLNAETLDGYKALIVLRDGMIWPDGYGGDESTNAAWVNTGKPKLVSDPPMTQSRAQSKFWMKPEQGKAVRNDRLVAVVETPYNPAEYRSLEEVNEQRLAEIEHFFISYNQVEGRQFKPLARRGAHDAQALLEQVMGGAGVRGNGARRSRGRGAK